VAANLMRGERRRRTWERQAVEMNALHNSDDGLAHIVPVLDEAINALKETDRLAILLRFYERRDLRSVGEALGSSENAAQKRVARALEQLQAMLRRRGIALSAAALVAALAGQSATAAPAGLAATVAESALAGAAASVGAGAAGASTTAPILTAMSTSKTVLIAAALVAAACIPVGYQVGTSRQSPPKTRAAPPAQTAAPAPARLASPDNSALLAEWRQLHDKYGRGRDAMPLLYAAIADLKDPSRRRAFHAALLAEWARVDPRGGLKFMLGKGMDGTQRRQFFEEWLALDPRAAVDALMAAGAGWEKLARDCLPEIARKVPSAVADIVAHLPKPDTPSFWDTSVREAFAIVAASGLEQARSAAQAITGPNREQALSGVAQAWGASDLNAAIAWAKSLPDATERDEAIRAALVGKAALDPAAALDLVGTVPPGGKEFFFATTTGARVLQAAAEADFDTTAAWLGAHPGRLGDHDLEGLVDAVTERLNADPAGFLDGRVQDGSLAAMLPAISNALLNQAAGQRAAVWDWLQAQPDNDITKKLKDQVIESAGWQDPVLAMSLVADLPRTPAGDSQVAELAGALLNSGLSLGWYDSLARQAPDRLQQPLLEYSFGHLNADNLGDPQQWIGRLGQLPEAARAAAAASLARAWAAQSPEDAAGWLASLVPGQAQNRAAAAVTAAWAKTDPQGAAGWAISLAPGPERDQAASSLVSAQAWDWALSITDPDQRSRAAAQAVQIMTQRDPVTAQEWIQTGPFAPQLKAELQAALPRINPKP
jgi:hypothetical protein